MELPTSQSRNYVGIDPGFTGALARINHAGTVLEVWDMPVSGSGKKREIDLAKLEKVFDGIALLPSCVVGLEWPTTRPGEGAERSERFGRGKGYLEAIAHCKRLDYYKIAPNLWKGRLSVPGKTDPKANKVAAGLFDMYYESSSSLIRGPRGGIKSGRVDAFLIAHFLRTRTVGGLRTVVEEFGKDSQQAMAYLFRTGKGPKRKKPLIS